MMTKFTIVEDLQIMLIQYNKALKLHEKGSEHLKSLEKYLESIQSNGIESKYENSRLYFSLFDRSFLIKIGHTERHSAIQVTGLIITYLLPDVFETSESKKVISVWDFDEIGNVHLTQKHSQTDFQRFWFREFLVFTNDLFHIKKD